MRTFVVLCVLSFFTSFTFADDETEKDDGKTTSEAKLRLAEINDAEAAKLSVEPEIDDTLEQLEAEANQRLDEEEAEAEAAADLLGPFAPFPIDEDAPRDTDSPGFFAAAKDSVSSSIDKAPIVWSVLGLVMALALMLVGKRSAGALLGVMAANSSKGEVAGSFAFVGGLFTLFNATAMTFNWSYIITNMFVASCVTMVFGIGMAAQASAKRKEGSSQRGQQRG